MGLTPGSALAGNPAWGGWEGSAYHPHVGPPVASHRRNGGTGSGRRTGTGTGLSGSAGAGHNVLVGSGLASISAAAGRTAGTLRSSQGYRLSHQGGSAG